MRGCTCGPAQMFSVSQWFGTPGTAYYNEEEHRLFMGVPLFVNRQTKYNPFVPGFIAGVGDKRRRALTVYDAVDDLSDEEDGER